jgi:hypothetical protein
LNEQQSLAIDGGHVLLLSALVATVPALLGRKDIDYAAKWEESGSKGSFSTL